MNRRVLVIAAHPDDEVLGCGGAIALHKSAGDHVTVLIGAGRSAEESGYGVSQASCSGKAAAVLGVDQLQFLSLPDQRLDTVPLLDITRLIEKTVTECQPAVVYVQHGGDVNHDHRVLFRAASVAVRPTCACIQTVYAFDTASSTEWAFPRTFVPDTWIDISTVLEKKLAAMLCYKPELRNYPHPRSIEALRHRANAWGNQCCIDAAEVFMTVRRIVRTRETLL